MNRSPERPIDEQWAVIKRARKMGLAVKQTDSQRVCARSCDRLWQLRGQWFDEHIGYEIIQDSPTVVETAILNLQSEYLSLLEYVLMLYIINL